MAKNNFPIPKPVAPVATAAPALDELAPEPVQEAVPAPLAAPAGDCGDCCHKLEDGETYASLGKRYAAPGQSGFEKALEIQALNGGKVLTPGACVKVK